MLAQTQKKEKKIFHTVALPVQRATSVNVPFIFLRFAFYSICLCVSFSVQRPGLPFTAYTLYDYSRCIMLRCGPGMF